MPWSSRFDAAILYDTMHHFDNEVETLKVIRRTLVPGGQLFIHEGVLPPKGSAGRAEPDRGDEALRNARVAVRPRVPRGGRRSSGLRPGPPPRGGRRAHRPHRLATGGSAASAPSDAGGAARVQHRPCAEPCDGRAKASRTPHVSKRAALASGRRAARARRRGDEHRIGVLGRRRSGTRSRTAP